MYKNTDCDKIWEIYNNITIYMYNYGTGIEMFIINTNKMEFARTPIEVPLDAKFHPLYKVLLDAKFRIQIDGHITGQTILTFRTNVVDSNRKNSQ